MCRQRKIFAYKACRYYVSLHALKVFRDSRIKKSIQNICKDITKCKNPAQHKHKALDNRIIVIGNGLDTIKPNAWYSKDTFNQQTTSNKFANMHTKCRNNGYKCIIEDMFCDNLVSWNITKCGI